MGWASLAIIALAAFAVLWLADIGRRLWMAAAALMLGAIGYALQGRPSLAAHPVSPNADPVAVDPGAIALRDAMVGRFAGDTAYLVAADSMRRIGDRGAAVQVILGGIRAVPESLPLWTGLGDALSEHDGGQVSPASLFAFQQAMRLSPRHPAPFFFLGMAYIRAGDFAAARPFWVRALALTPPAAPYRKEIALRLALLDQFLAMQAVTEQEVQ